MHPSMRQTVPNIVDVPEELRERALKRTADVLRKVDEVRLPVVFEIYGEVVATLIAEEQRKELAARTSRRPITLQSETRDYLPMKIKRGDTHAVIVRPQTMFRPEQLTIQGDRSRWMIHDIKVGNQSQFVGKRGPSPGTEFGPGGICEHLQLATCQMAMDLAIVVEYVGPEADGEVFEATMVGTATEF